MRRARFYHLFVAGLGCGWKLSWKRTERVLWDAVTTLHSYINPGELPAVGRLACGEHSFTQCIHPPTEHNYTCGELELSFTVLGWALFGM